MANKDLYLRSDADKGEVSPDTDLRLRADADKEAGDEFVYVGDIALALVPGYSSIVNRIYAGALAATLLPDAPTAILEKSYTGDLSLTVLLDAPVALLSKSYAGDLDLIKTPNSIYELVGFTEFVYGGDILLNALPSSTCILNRVYAGEIFMDLTPSSTRILDMIYSGDISMVALPESICSLSEPSAGEFVYDGNISFIMLPSYASSMNKAYEGVVALNLLPDFAFASLEKSYAGSLFLAVTPEALYSLEQMLQEFAYGGDVLLSLLPGYALIVGRVYEGDVNINPNPVSQYSLETPEGYIPAAPKATIYELSDELKALGNYGKKKHFSHEQLATDMNRFGWDWTEKHIANMFGGNVAVSDEHREFFRRYLLTRYYNETLKEA